MSRISQLKRERQVEISARPIRYAYILGIEPSRKLIIQIISSCCESHGGVHNLIIPSNGKTIEPCWKQFLYSVDPDIIFLCGKFTDLDSLKSQLVNIDIQPFAIKTWRGEQASSPGIIHYSPLPVDNIYNVKSGEARGLGKKAEVIVAARNILKNDLIDYFNYGYLSRKFANKFTDALDFTSINKVSAKSESVKIDPTVVCLENITYAEHEYFDDTVFEDTVLGPYVVITGDRNSLEDCCLFWNWRALTTRQFFIRWIDRDNLKALYEDEIFGRSILDLPPNAKLLTSYSIGKSNSKVAKKLVDSISNYTDNMPKMGFAYKHPSEYDYSLVAAYYFCTKDTTLISEGGKFQIKRIITPPYDYKDCMFNDLVIDLSIQTRTPGDKSGIIVSPRYNVSDVLTLGQEEIRTECRINGQYFTILLPSSISTGSIYFSVNSDWDIISKYCKRKGLDIVESPAGKHIRRAIELAGSIEDIAKYYQNNIAKFMLDSFKIRHNPKVNLTNQKMELYRRSFSIKDLKETVIQNYPSISTYQKKKIEIEIDRLINIWWEKGILISGFQLECEECNFLSWYPIEMVGDDYICLRCQLRNKRPHDSQIHYRLQESFYQAHLENMIVPILSLNYIKNKIANESFIYTVPVCIKPNDSKSPEVDFIAMADGMLLIAECKKPNKLDNEVFTRYGEIAKKIKCHHVVFSTTTRENSCKNLDCNECIKLGNEHSDEIFTHGISSNSSQYGTREKIKDFRNKMDKEGIMVDTLCVHDLGIA